MSCTPPTPLCHHHVNSHVRACRGDRSNEITHAHPHPYPLSPLQESHTDLREWYVHCLDFRALKRRLVDDPPDPYDDHPSMMGPLPASSSAAAGEEASNGGGGGGAPSAAVTAADADLEQRQALLMGGQAGGGGGGGSGVLEAGKTIRDHGGGSAGVWGNAAAGGGGSRGVSLAFPDPASRVFVFEIKEVCDARCGAV